MKEMTARLLGLTIMGHVEGATPQDQADPDIARFSKLAQYWDREEEELEKERGQLGAQGAKGKPSVTKGPPVKASASTGPVTKPPVTAKASAKAPGGKK